MTNGIRAARERSGLTQGGLAQKLGVSRQTIHAVETGKYVPSTILALKLAREFNQAVEQLFQLEQED